MTDGQVVAIADSADEDEWVDVVAASKRLGYDSATILRLIQDGDIPVLQVAGRKRTANRIPRALVDEARRLVFAGGQVELRAFARQWSARNQAPEAVAS